MTKSVHIGDARIPFDDYVTQGTAILGIRGAGKTYTAKGIAEQLLDAKVPVIVFDAIGVWRFLKVASDSSGGKAYKVVVAGGEHPDLPLTPHSAPQIIRAAIRENIPLVVDLYDTKLSKADWRRIVQESFRILLYENQGLRHIFLEEAAEYCPQKIQDSNVYAEVEKLVRMGGNKSLGITMINQRSQELNKSVLELCDNLVMMRQKGFNAIAYAEKWAERLSPTEAKEIGAALPNMQAGECVIFTDAYPKPIFARSNPILSFHPDRKRPEHPKNSTVADPTEFVQKLSAELQVVIEEAKANDPAELKRTISDLKRKLSLAEQKQPEVKQSEPIKVPFISEETEWVMKACVVNIESLSAKITEQMDLIHRTCVEMQKEFHSAAAKLSAITSAPRLVTPIPKAVRTALTQQPILFRSSSNGSLPQGERTILTALAQHHTRGCTREQLTVITGYKRSSRDTYIQRLSAKGYINVGIDSIFISGEGIAALGDFEPLPTGRALIDYHLENLPAGERTVFQCLVNTIELPREAIDELTGYKRSSRDTYIQRLSARQLVDTSRPGVVRISQHLLE